MRTIWRGLSLAWLVLVGLVFSLPLPPLRQSDAWQGATLGWSPRASVDATGDSALWDVRGWLDEGSVKLHGDLNRVESQLWSNLDSLLASVYEWRDQA